MKITFKLSRRPAFTSVAAFALSLCASAPLTASPAAAPPASVEPAPPVARIVPATEAAGTSQTVEITRAPPPPAPTPMPSPATAPVVVAPTPTVGPIIDTPPVAPVATPEASGGDVAFELPRESQIENPLGRARAITGTAIGGYGELTLVKPSNGDAIVDLRRFVVYIGHNFSDNLRFYSEIEVEHAVSSADDAGEVEIEQAYLDGLVNHHLNLRGGLIPMPVGIINIYHEPPTFNGVDRPDVDTLVIPSTWREPGIGIFGEFVEGLRYQLFLVNGFQASGFSASAGLRDGHQEGQLARARDFGAVARIDYEPVLATDFGLSGYFASSGRTIGGNVGSVPVGLVEADFRTAVGGFTARAELAIAFIGDTTALNQYLSAGSEEQAAAVPISSQLRGGYLEAGYDVLRLISPGSAHGLTAFGRYDYTDTQARVRGGFQRQTNLPRHSLMAGLVYRPIPSIGLKGDYRRRMPGEGDGWNVWSAAITWMF